MKSMLLSFNIAIMLLFLTLINACSKSHLSKKYKQQQQLIRAHPLVASTFHNGIDFLAHGENPVHWTLEMSFNNNFSFNASNNVHISTSPVFPLQQNNSNVEIYAAKSGKQEMNITLTETSKKNNQKKVDILIGGNNYTGIGEFSFDYRLNDTWVLSKISADSLIEKMFLKGLPNLQLNLLKNNFKGFNGSFIFYGKIKVKGSSIQFYNISPTKRNPNESEVNKLNNLIENNSAEYYIKGDTLVLILQDETRLFFNKKSSYSALPFSPTNQFSLFLNNTLNVVRVP